MGRTFEACAESTNHELSSMSGSWFQISADVVEAIPANTPFGEVGVRIGKYARLVSRSPKTVERWRDTALVWSPVIEFPPQGGLAKVGYTVFRDLPSAFGGDAEAAHEFLQGFVDGRPSSERLSRPTVFAGLPEEIKASKKAKHRAARETGNKTPKASPAWGMTAAVTELDPLVSDSKKNLTVDAEIRLGLEAAQATLNALDGESRFRFDQVQRAIRKALQALSSVSEQLSIEA